MTLYNNPPGGGGIQVDVTHNTLPIGGGRN